MAAAFLWGLCDLVAKVHMPQWNGSLSWVLWSQTAGSCIYAAYFIAVPSAWPALSPGWFGFIAFFGLIGLGGYVFFFRAIERGNLSLVSPIGASWAGVSFILSAIFLPQVLPVNAWLALLIVLGGVILTSMSRRKNTQAPAFTAGFADAAASALCWGVYNFSLKFSGEHAGMFFPVFAVKVWGAILCIVLVARGKLRLPPLNLPLRGRHNLAAVSLGAVAALDIIAYALYIHGTQRGLLPVVAAFASLFSLFAALFGTLLLKERLSRLQLLGIALIVIGGFTLGLLD